MRENYFTKLWATSKGLFFGVMLFIFGQAFFMYKGILNFPFFPFQMYAFPFVEPGEVSQTEILVNGKLLDYTRLPDWNESTIVRTVKFYERQHTRGNWAGTAWKKRFGTPETEFEHLIYNRLVPTDEQLATYPNWIANYIGTQTNQNVSTLNISRKYYQYENQRLVPTGKETVILDYRR